MKKQYTLRNCIMILLFLLVPLFFFNNLNTSIKEINEDIESDLSLAVSNFWEYETEGSIQSSPAIRDIDNDGLLDVVCGSSDGNVYVFDNLGNVKWVYNTGFAVQSSPVIGDIDNDNNLEIIIGNNGAYLFTLNAENGSLQWKFYVNNEMVQGSPVLCDINNDNDLEIVIGAGGGSVIALDGNGSVIWWRDIHGATGSPSVADIDDDDKLEIIVGCTDEYIFALNAEDGSDLWQFQTNDWVWWSSAGIGDLDRDDKQEVVIGCYDGNVYCINGEDGTLQWQYQTNGRVLSSPAIYDVDGDNILEVFIGSEDNNMYALKEDGTPLWIYNTNNEIISSAALGDLDGDNNAELVFGTWNYEGLVFCLNAEDGTPLWTFSTNDIIKSSPAIGDLNNDGELELVIGSYDKKIYALKPTSSGSNIYWQGLSGDNLFHRTKCVSYSNDEDISIKITNLVNNSIVHYKVPIEGEIQGWYSECEYNIYAAIFPESCGTMGWIQDVPNIWYDFEQSKWLMNLTIYAGTQNLGKNDFYDAIFWISEPEIEYNPGDIITEIPPYIAKDEVIDLYRPDGNYAIIQDPKPNTNVTWSSQGTKITGYCSLESNCYIYILIHPLSTLSLYYVQNLPTFVDPDGDGDFDEWFNYVFFGCETIGLGDTYTCTVICKSVDNWSPGDVLDSSELSEDVIFRYDVNNLYRTYRYVYVDDDNTGMEDGSYNNPYNTIQEGINAAGVGDVVYVLSGTYSENLVVGKSLSLIGEDRYSTIIDGGGSGDIVSITASNVNISHFTIRNGTQGVHGENIGNHYITDCEVIFNENYGIHFRESPNINIWRCNISNTWGAGDYGIEKGIAIQFFNCPYSRVENITMKYNRNKCRVFIPYHSDNTVIKNVFLFNNSGGIYAGFAKYYMENITILNNSQGITFNGASHGYLKNSVFKYINKFAIEIIYNSIYNVISNNTIIGCGQGINLIYNNSGANNQIYKNYFINNAINANVAAGAQPQIWDDGSIGNYWDDYTGSDENGDGIGDIPYTMGDSLVNQDNYPIWSDGF
ncbi:MAG: PQQ-binding-like beta-propeller repeat protein [Candidatus Odinarchaeota archaeon]